METQYLPGTSRERLVDDTGIRFAIGAGLVVLTLFVAGLAGLGTPETAAAAVLVAGLASGRLPIGVGAVLGAIAWAFFTGFFENAFGQLTFAGGDLVRLAGFAFGTVAVGSVARGLLRHGSAVTHG